MKLGRYIKDNFYFIILFNIMIFLNLFLLVAFRVKLELIISILFVLLFFMMLLLFINYFRRKNFYNELINNLEFLDQKYLILETIDFPNFYDGEILYNILYEVNKSMLEKVKEHVLSINDFKDYIEMWIHEVKIPVSSLTLMAHNHKSTCDNAYFNEIKKIENCIEQVLYYVRSENAEKDYLIKENKLSKIISNVALKNKNDLLENKIDFLVEDNGLSVLTDSKWLEFILNQVINNSIKYRDTKKEDKYIKISAKDCGNIIELAVTDNGIGIDEKDLTRVFEKSFTGENGHSNTKSTGMGLYIAWKLCQKLGHKISISSKQNEFTKITIIFGKTDFYDIK